MFNGLENWLNITLTVLVIVVGVLLLFFIANAMFALWFKSVLKKHAKSMTVALNAKYDNIKKLFSIMSKLGVQFDEKYVSTLNSVNVEDFRIQHSEACKIARDKLTYLRDEALFLSRRNEKLEKNNEFMIAKNNVLEMDTVYRTTVANYNADVLGFNYWVRFLPFRWIWKLLKVKTKDLI